LLGGEVRRRAGWEGNTIVSTAGSLLLDTGYDDDFALKTCSMTRIYQDLALRQHSTLFSWIEWLLQHLEQL
jgi:hypothetical protein